MTATSPFVSATVPLTPDAARLDDQTRDAVASYLDSGHTLAVARGYGDDVVSGKTFRVPIGFATDGLHVWSLAVAYYVRTYGLAPSPDDLVARAVDSGGVCPEVSAEDAKAILDAVIGSHLP